MAAALGFAPHSGWAALVALAVADGRPHVVARDRIVMADERDPESKQPYHAIEELPIKEAARRLAGYEKTANRMAQDAVRQVVDELQKDGHKVVGIGILDSSGRSGDSLEAILASHALIHTADGDHYRRALAAAAEGCGVQAVRVRARDLEQEAASALRQTPEKLKQTLKDLGREVGPPWTADHKGAALLAWLILSRQDRVGLKATP
jgi:hypothetical protein